MPTTELVLHHVVPESVRAKLIQALTDRGLSAAAAAAFTDDYLQSAINTMNMAESAGEGARVVSHPSGQNHGGLNPDRKSSPQYTAEIGKRVDELIRDLPPEGTQITSSRLARFRADLDRLSGGIRILIRNGEVEPSNPLAAQKTSPNSVRKRCSERTAHLL